MYAVQYGLPVSECLCARKYIVNKKIPERWGQKLSGSVQQKWTSFQQVASCGEMEFRDREVLERRQVTNLVMEDRMQNKAHFPVERKKTRPLSKRAI